MLVVAIALTLLFAYSSVVQARTYFGGEQTTAHVDRCHAHRESSGHLETVCSGSWRTSDGRRHDGEVPEAERSDIGDDVPVRVLGDAIVDDSPTTLWPFLGFLVGVGVIIVLARRLARRRADPARPGTRSPTGQARRAASGGGRSGSRTGPTYYGPPPPAGTPTPPGWADPGQREGAPAYPEQPAAPQYGPPAYPQAGTDPTAPPRPDGYPHG